MNASAESAFKDSTGIFGPVGLLGGVHGERFSRIGSLPTTATTAFESDIWGAEHSRRWAETLSDLARYRDELAVPELGRARDEEEMWAQLRRPDADISEIVPVAAPVPGTAILSETLIEAVDPGYAAGTEVSLFWLRAGFAAFLLLFTGGLGLLSFVLETDAPALLRRISLVAMWAGPAAVAAAAHLHGLGTGVYLFGKRLSEVAAIFAVGMFVIAIVGTIEFSVR